jgi:predicted nucleic acid-binding protein
LTLVADTNVVAALFLPSPHNATVLALIRRDRDWHLPPLWQSEFRHVLLKYVRAGMLVEAKAMALWKEALALLSSGETPVQGLQVLDLAIRSGCSSYDAEFVVLARRLACPLLTLDRRLLQLFPDVAILPGS